MGDPGFSSVGGAGGVSGSGGSEWWSAEGELLSAPQRMAGGGVKYQRSAKQVRRSGARGLGVRCRHRGGGSIMVLHACSGARCLPCVCSCFPTPCPLSCPLTFDACFPLLPLPLLLLLLPPYTQVDVRALKDLLWDSLVTVNSEQQQQQADSNSRSPASSAPQAADSSAAVIPFQDVIVAVPSDSAAGPLEDVSVHMCFICLLHLANEKGLVVRAQEDLKTLTISNVQQ